MEEKMEKTTKKSTKSTKAAKDVKETVETNVNEEDRSFLQLPRRRKTVWNIRR